MSAPYLLCLSTSLTLPYDSVHSVINSMMPAGTAHLLSLWRYSMMSIVCNPTDTAAYKLYAVNLYSCMCCGLKLKCQKNAMSKTALSCTVTKGMQFK